MTDTTTSEPTLTLTRDLARELGDGWAAEPFDPARPWDDGVLIGPDARVRVTTAHEPEGRVKLIGLPPADLPRDARIPAHSTTARLTRGPRAIAGQIRRHLLPTYLISVREAREKHARMAITAARQAATVANAAARLHPLGEAYTSHDRGQVIVPNDPEGAAAGREGRRLAAVVEVTARPERWPHKVALNVPAAMLDAVLSAIASVVAPNEDADTGEVWSVQRLDQEDGYYLFDSEHRARQYAKPYGDEAIVNREFVMNDSAAGQFIIDSAGEED